MAQPHDRDPALFKPFLHRPLDGQARHGAISDVGLVSLGFHWPPVPTTLRLPAIQVYRELDDLGHAFAGYRCVLVKDALSGLLDSLPVQPLYPCAFRTRYRGTTQPEMMLVFERVLAVFAALRVNLPSAADRRPEVVPEDYQALRAMLTCLPIVPLDRELTPQALVSSEAIYEALRSNGCGLELPDLSRHG